jgi:CheY-like chemotaxis protein
MNAIIGFCTMLNTGKLDATQKKYLGNIQNASTTLLSLINDLLDFSKIEAGKLEIIEAPFNLPKLLEQLTQMYQIIALEKSISFVSDFQVILPVALNGDEKRLRQVLNNLLSNAIKYSSNGSIIFHVTAKESENFVDLTFSVEDTGIGIKEEDIPKLFEAFQQLDQARNKTVQGTGLGLAITKNLVEAMGGTISVKSDYGHGSTFSVDLRLKRASEKELSIEVDNTIIFNAPSAQILLVDDVEINLEIAAFMLEAHQIKADTALSGPLSIDMSLSKNYDLILMDHMMPGMDGVEAVKYIRCTNKWNASVPIVALTANAVSGAREMFLSKSFNGLLAKPIDPKSMSETLLQFLPVEKIEVKPGP